MDKEAIRKKDEEAIRRYDEAQDYLQQLAQEEEEEYEERQAYGRVAGEEY